MPPAALTNVHFEDDLENVINQVSVSCENGTETLQDDDQSKSPVQKDNIPTGTEVENIEEECVPDDNKYLLTDLDESTKAIKNRELRHSSA
mgnify:CR=1 FL=1